MDKKYELTDETIEHDGLILYRIKALTSVNPMVRPGDLGGYVEKEENLSQRGSCWVYDDAKVFNDAIVRGSAQVMDTSQIYHSAIVCQRAKVVGDSVVCGNAVVCVDAEVIDSIMCDGAVTLPVRRRF